LTPKEILDIKNYQHNFPSSFEGVEKIQYLPAQYQFPFWEVNTVQKK